MTRIKSGFTKIVWGVIFELHDFVDALEKRKK